MSNEAVNSAGGAGRAEFAPVEMNSAHEKLALSKQAIAAKDCKLANQLVMQAEADAKLAQGKANSGKPSSRQMRCRTIFACCAKS